MTPLSSVVDVTEADVWKRGRRVGVLRRTPEGVVFAYLDGYDGPAVATTLPVGIQPPPRPGGALPAYFTGLLPEGRRLSALRRAVKTSVDDELSLLLAVGGDTVGDVQVVPTGDDPVAPPARISLDVADLRFRELLVELDVQPDRTALPGVQVKASAAMITLPGQRLGRSVILKLDPPEYPGLVVNEHVMLQACSRSGVAAASATVVRDVEGVAGLAVTRFDRIVDDAGRPRALAVEDGCQVQGRAPGDKYVLGYAATFAALARVCDAQALALRSLLEQLVFAVLTANGDAHAKNFAVLQQPDGEWQVAPAYDIPSSQPYGDTTLAMAVNGRRADVGAKDVTALATELGLPSKVASRVLRNAVDRVDGWLPLLAELPYDIGKRRKLERVIRQRQKRLAP